ncbi:MAG: CatB-related O-acetyltransferase [Candidatus Gastranaerophilaceae bacterium]
MQIRNKLARELKRLSNQLFHTNYPLNETNTFGEGSHITGTVVLLSNIHIGAYTYLRNRVFVYDNVTIGSYGSIANDAVIAPAEHPTDWFTTSPTVYSSMVLPEIHTYIGNDVWIGTKAIVKAGVKIGDGAIVGAGAIVTKDVPPYAIVAGVPAKIIKYRFDEETIKRLLALKWWDMPHETFKNLPYKDVYASLDMLEKIKAEQK